MKKPAAIVTDIEGTTSSIAFVHDVLFPYARRKMTEFVHRHRKDTDVAALLEEVGREIDGDAAGSADIDRLIETLCLWIDEDRKAAPLKALQGLIWEEGYRAGDFTGHVYEDAVRRLRAWHADGIALYVYSSGSVRAQKLLFGHSDAGDLTPIFAGYFDTRTGHKREPGSYVAIARRIGRLPAGILFLSDVVAELDAAGTAGMHTLQVARDATVARGRHRCVPDFDAIKFAPQILN